MSIGIAHQCSLPDDDFDVAWEAIKIDQQVRDRLVAQSMLSLTIRRSIPFDVAPLHGLIVLAGPPGTGKTTLARGLASRIGRMLKKEKVTFVQIDPHGLGSAAFNKSQQQVTTLFQQTLPEVALNGPAIILLDEVETLAADRRRMSLEANPVDAHRSTDAVLSGLDLLTRQHNNILLVATTNYPEVVDPAFMSRADLIESIPLPNDEARAEIIEDMLSALAKQWPKVGSLKTGLQDFVSASKGLDGRRLRKTIIGAAAQSIETAQDLNKLTSSQILAALKAAKPVKERPSETA